MAGDSLSLGASAPTKDLLAVLKETLALPPRPKKAADQQAWLMDGYRRLLKAELAFDSVRRTPGESRPDAKAVSEARFKLWDLRHQLEDADKGGKAKQAFFDTVLPAAQAKLGALADFPAPPEDRAGKAAWLAEGKQKLNEAKASQELIRAAWLKFQAAPFEDQVDSSRAMFEFESRLRRVEYELNPPAPRPATPGKPASGNGPLFGNSQGVADALNKNPNNPIVQVGGAVALPIALTIDVLDAITRPFVWLDKVAGGK